MIINSRGQRLKPNKHASRSLIDRALAKEWLCCAFMWNGRRNCTYGLNKVFWIGFKNCYKFIGIFKENQNKKALCQCSMYKYHVRTKIVMPLNTWFSYQVLRTRKSWHITHSCKCIVLYLAAGLCTESTLLSLICGAKEGEQARWGGEYM